MERRKRTAPASGKGKSGISRREPNKALAFLARLANEFTAVLNLPNLLEHVMTVLHEEIGFDSCTVALTDEHDPEALVVRAASGIRRNYLGLHIPSGKGLHGAVMQTGAPLLIPEMGEDPRVYRRETGIRSGIYTPLAVEGRTIGVLSAHRSERNAFADADLDLLTVVAGYLAGAIEVARLHEQLKEAAATDPLTGLANRRSFLDRVAAEMARLRRTDGFLSISLLDLNHLKLINDTHGHAVGDGALVTVAQTLRSSIRASDLAARFGGDEFTLLMPDTTRIQADEILDRIGVAAMVVSDDRSGRLSVTFSWGVATWPDDGADAESVLRAADARLYERKTRGATLGPSAPQA